MGTKEHDDAISNAVAAIFGEPRPHVRTTREGRVITVTVENEDTESRPFTLAQMMQLPAILGTEHLNFRNESGHSSGSSWTGDYGHYNNLVIEATLPEEARSPEPADGKAGVDAGGDGHDG